MQRFELDTKAVRRSIVLVTATLTVAVFSMFVVASFYGPVFWPGALGSAIGFVVVYLFLLANWSRLKKLAVLYDKDALIVQRAFCRDKVIYLDDIRMLLEVTGSRFLRNGVLLRYGLAPWKSVYLRLEYPENFVSSILRDHPGLSEKVVRRSSGQ